MLQDTLVQFNEKLSSKEAVPGGGGAASLCAALAASLSSMVTELTIGKKRYREFEEENLAIREEAVSLRNLLLEGIEKDAEAFYPLSVAYGKDKNAPGYAEELEECLWNAAEAPAELLRHVCRVIELDERLAETGSKLAISDAASSASLAYGALYAAFINVKVNTRLMKNKERASALEKEMRELRDEYAHRAMQVYERVEERLNG